MSAWSGLWPSPWPAEDGGPVREQAPRDLAGLGIADGERLRLAATRDAFGTTMVILRDPGEVFALRHTLGRRPLRDPSVAWVERIDPVTLEPLVRSPELAGGPFWPGGLAAHANGSLHVIHGRWCHRLSPGLELLASVELPQPRPYNSFVVLADGTLASRCEEIELPEPAIARLAADADMIYVVGATTIWRYRWDGTGCTRDEDWELRYHGGAAHSYGWDPVICDGHAWFLDNGAHRYATTMRGAALSSGPVRLFRVSLADAADHESVEVCGARRGAVTDPPLYDPARRIVVAYDSANGVLAGFVWGGRVAPLWRRKLDHAAHMILFGDTGELVVHDFHGPAAARGRFAGAVAQHISAPARSAAIRRRFARRYGDDVVVLDIETGAERARARVPSMFQSVLFPAPGFARDVYWCTFSTLARLEVA